MERKGKYWKKENLSEAIDEALEKVFGGEEFLIKHYEDKHWADTTKWAIYRPLDTPRKCGQVVIHDEYIGLIEHFRDVDGYHLSSTNQKDTRFDGHFTELVKEIEKLSGKNSLTEAEYDSVGWRKQSEQIRDSLRRLAEEYESGGGGIDGAAHRLRKELGGLDGVSIRGLKEQECGGDYYIEFSADPRLAGPSSMGKIPKKWEGYDVRIEFTH